MALLQNSGIISNDFIIMAHNYARLLAETGETHRAIEALKKCAGLVKSVNTDMCTDYADMVFDIGAILSKVENIHAAEPYFAEAFRVYRAILPEDILRDKCEIALNYFKGARGVKLPDYLVLDNYAKN